MSARSFIYSLVFIFCLSGFINAQEGDAQKEKELRDFYNSWMDFLKEGDVEAYNKLQPKDHVEKYLFNGTITETTFEENYNDFKNQFENGKFVEAKYLSDPIIKIFPGSDYAWIVWEIETEYKSNSSDKTNKIRTAGLEVLQKMKDQWALLYHSSSSTGERDSVTVAKEILDDYSGTYKSKSSGNTYEISNDGKRLLFKIPDGSIHTYVPQSDYSFFRQGMPHSLVFGRDKSGKVTHYTYVINNQSVQVDKN